MACGTIACGTFRPEAESGLCRSGSSTSYHTCSVLLPRSTRNRRVTTARLQRSTRRRWPSSVAEPRVRSISASGNT